MNHAVRSGPPPIGPDPPPATEPRGTLIFQDSYTSSQIDEIEHVVSSRVTPHRLVPLSRDNSVDSSFRFHGAGNLAVFDIRYGRQVAVEFEHYEAEDLLGFVMANEGKGRVFLDREEFGISQNAGVMITSGPRETLHYSEDCETRVLLMNRTKIAEYCGKLLNRDIETPLTSIRIFPLKRPPVTVGRA